MIPRQAVRILAAAMFLPFCVLPCSAIRAGEAPYIEAHQSRWLLFGDGVARYTVHGGSTDAPPDELGRPPWIKTGNRRYIWKVRCQEGMLQTEPAAGAATTQDTLMVVPNVAGSFSVNVFLQEEWRDSGDDARTIYWPEEPEPTP